jgi:hypothetical protein
VSILNRFAADRHLDDDVLAAIWSSASSEGRTATHPHLTSCAQCRARYAALTGWLADLREEAHLEADETFPPERLAAQQAAIFRRLEALERPARVIAFPKYSRPAPASQPFTRRWIATAAAAGLVIGLAAGQILDLRHALEGPDQPVRSTSPSPVSSQTTARSAGVQPASLSLDEELFYGDFADSASRAARYLPALDELTPRARDDSDRNR